MHRSLLFLALFLCCALNVKSKKAHAELSGDTYSSKEWRVTTKAPRSWQKTERTSYPNVLLWMARQNPPGKMLLSAQGVSEGFHSADYRKKTERLLKTMGFTI